MIGSFRIRRFTGEIVEGFRAVPHHLQRILHIASLPRSTHQPNIVFVILDVQDGLGGHGESCLSFCSCLSSHSAPIGPSGWFAWRKTFTASSIVRMSPASMALTSVR